MDSISFIPNLLGVAENPKLGMYLLYFVILILCVAVYLLGFAKKLPLLKNVVIYALLAAFCTVLTFFGAFLPVAEGLIVILLILAVYKIRMKFEYKKQDGEVQS